MTRRGHFRHIYMCQKYTLGAGQPGSGEGDLFGGFGGDLHEPEGGQAQAEQDAGMIRQRVAQAAHAARMAGKLSGGLERLVGEVLNPKVRWQDLLRDFMTRTTKDDETWRMRNRRFSSVYLPARYSERMGEIIVIGDTSGSIGDEELNQVGAEVTAISEQLNPERVRMIWADTEVAAEQSQKKIGGTPDDGGEASPFDTG